jgi:membrane-bound serine protease (ClpP class)
VDAFIIIAAIGFGLLLSELLLPTGGVLAVVGAAGLVVAGVVALGSDSTAADAVGGALIALGVVSAAAFFFVARKVVAAQRQSGVRAGSDELVGADAEARTAIDPDGRVWLDGALWSARLADPGAPARLGDRVRVEAVDGLTLVVRPEPQAAETKEGAS